MIKYNCNKGTYIIRTEGGNATKLLESGSITIYDGNGEEKFCDFEITQNDADLFKTIVKVTDIR